MISDYDKYLIGQMRFSYTSLSSFESCKYGWYMNYVREEGGIPNFFSEFGILVHKVLEGVYKGEIPEFAIDMAYEEMYGDIVVSSPPPFPKGLAGKYYDAGLEFFQNFVPDVGYKILEVEPTITTEIGGVPIKARPDLIVSDTRTGDIILFDYKTSKPIKKNGDMDEEKIRSSYEKQMALYATALKDKYKINKIGLLFVRLGETYWIDFTPEMEKEAVSWVSDTVSEIKKEIEFEPNTTNNYFCNILCGVRYACKFRQPIYSSDGEGRSKSKRKKNKEAFG